MLDQAPDLEQRLAPGAWRSRHASDAGMRFIERPPVARRAPDAGARDAPVLRRGDTATCGARRSCREAGAPSRIDPTSTGSDRESGIPTATRSAEGRFPESSTVDRAIHQLAASPAASLLCTGD